MQACTSLFIQVRVTGCLGYIQFGAIMNRQRWLFMSKSSYGKQTNKQKQKAWGETEQPLPHRMVPHVLAKLELGRGNKPCELES